MHKQLFVPVMLLSACSGVQADVGADGGETYFDSFPIVLSASRLRQPADEAAATVTVIDREMIKMSGAREVVDLFRLVPGMVVGQYKAHQPSIGFFGLADPLYRQLQVLIDGVSIYSSAWGGAEWSELPIALEDIERIEIVRGPNAAAYGANSFLGVVNIITRDPAVEHGTEVVANLGENKIRDTHVRLAASGENLRYRLTAGQRADAGLDAFPDTRRTNFFNLRAQVRMSHQDELRLQTAYAGGSQEDGLYQGETDGPRTAHYDSGSFQLRWTRAAGADEETWVQLSHSSRVFRDVVPYFLLIPNIPIIPAPLRGSVWNYPVDYSYDRRRTDLELQQTMRISDAIRGVWGGQVREDGVRSPTYFSSSDWLSSNLYRVFGNLEVRPADRWIATVGGMLEKNSFTGTSFSPSLSINREVVPNHTVRVRIARANRTPTLYEDRADWAYRWPSDVQSILSNIGSPLANVPLAQSAIGNPDLKDEKVRSRELSYLSKFPELRLSLELSWFEHRISDLIRFYDQTVPTVLGKKTWHFRNDSSARVTGTSGSVRWVPVGGTSIYLAASRAQIKADGADAVLIEASGPQNTFSALVGQELGAGVQVSCGYYLVGPMQPLSSGDPLPRSEKVDIRLARVFIVGSTRVEVAAIVQRATGDEPVFWLNTIDKRTSWLSMQVHY